MYKDMLQCDEAEIVWSKSQWIIRDNDWRQNEQHCEPNDPEEILNIYFTQEGQ